VIKNINDPDPDEILCFYSQYFLNTENTENLAEISEVIKKSGKTPYIYIRHSLKFLIDGEFNKSFRLIQYAGRIGNIFYPAGSLQGENFRQTINLMQYVVIHLSDEFRDL